MSKALFSADADRILIHDGSITLHNAGDLLERYVATDDDAPMMQSLTAVRDHYLNDLDQVENAAQVVGLIAWLLRDHKISHQGESLAETADRLCELDNNSDDPALSQVIYHLRDALERLDDLEVYGD